ncbi:MAG: hypothetical protein ACXABY_06115, partial [Candidatus Thorarchaeota archaeon]
MKFMNVLKLFAEKKEQFERKQGWIARLPNLDNNIKTMLTTITKYYEQYPEHEYIGPAELKEFYEFLYPGSRDKEMFFELIDAMYEAEVSTNVQEDITEQAIEMAFAQDICNKLLPVAQGHKFGIVPTLTTDVEEFTGQMKRPPKNASELEMHNYDPWELLQDNLNYEGPPWNLDPLNDLLGPIQLQTLGCFFGFVDSGKTSCVLDILARAAEYYYGTDETICFLGNEEPDRRVATRLQMAFLHRHRHELGDMGEEDLGVMLEQRGWKQTLTASGVHHVSQVRKCLELYSPRLLVIDRGAKVMHDFRCKEVDVLQTLYNWYREMAEEFNCAIVTVEQGIGEANKRQWIELTDIYNSRVGIQGELDYAVGIGKLADENKRNFRYFNVS